MITASHKTNFFRLALALAHEHVPGFKLDLTLRLDGPDEGPWLVVQDNNRGRPSEWPEKRLDLLSAVEQAKKRHNLSTDHDALSLLARHGKWSRPAGPRSEQWLKTLKNRLAEARRVAVLVRTAEAGLLDAQLASLPSLDESRAEIVQLIQAPASKIARLLSTQRSDLSQDNPGN
jgi:hypothetical protein